MEINEVRRQHIGVFLLAAVIFLSGYIVYSQKSEPVNYVPVARNEVNNGKSTNDVKTSGSVVNKSVQIININTASLEDLDTLPGIGEKTAQKIIEHRKANGPFKTKEAIMDVSGIGESKYSQIQDLINI
jgi:competence protein ComEA